MVRKRKNASHDPETRYVLTLTPEQARVVSRACELFTRLHIGQFNELTWELLDFSCEDYCERRDMAEPILRQLRQVYFPDLVLPGASYGVGKHIASDRAWDVYQVIRHAMAWHEHPEGGTTVDFHTPYSAAHEKLATCEVVT